MRLALMQPYFFPYLSYFELIHRADEFIYFDTVQFRKGGWINRNRIMTGAGDWRYLTVPLIKHPLDTPICDVCISETADWRRQLRNALDYYRGKAPYFVTVTELFNAVINEHCTRISNLNILAIDKVCEYLNIPISYDLWSAMQLNIDPVEKPKDWALNISKAMGAKEYLNLPGGSELYSNGDFRDAGIKLSILDLPSIHYECGSEKQIPNLSILDVMMWLPPEQIREYLERRSYRSRHTESTSEERV